MIYLKLIRPKQWLKNSFVLAPLIFSGQINLDLILAATKSLIIFIISSSCVYIFNDLKDLEYDKQHPKKKLRPIASGEIRPRNALLFLIFLLGLNVLAIYAFGTSGTGIALISGYLLLNLLYSSGLKDVPLLELAILSSGFVIRLLFGAEETSINLSPWIIICTGLLSLMIAVGKRRNDLKHQTKNNGPFRTSLRGYNLEFLDHVNSMLAGVTIVSYLLFCASQYTLLSMGPYILWTSPFVVFNILRYLQLISIDNLGEDPTLMLVGDKISIALFTSWLFLIIVIIYLN